MKIYLAGPMRGIPNFNFPAFYFAAAKLRQEGHDVFSPAEKGEEAELTKNPNAQESMDFRRKVFLLDTDYICREADCVALLQGWEKSTGANAEVALAKAIGIKTMVLGPEYNITGWQGQTLSDAEIDVLVEAWQPGRPLPQPQVAPTTGIPSGSEARKEIPITTGVIDYFPLALAYVAKISFEGNKKHNPGQPLHWAREKSKDHADCIGRHLVERGTKDGNLYHDGMLAWRALANCQLFLEDLLKKGINPFA